MIGVPAHPPVHPADRPLRELIDACVMCGLCLPQCPTYRLSGNEAESPRGRIALAAGLLDGRLAAEPAALAHLDHCLGCLSCQAVCPSQVRYEDILVGTRACLDAQRPRSWLRRALRDPRLLARASRVAALTRAWRWLPWLAALLPRGSLLRRIAQTQPRVPSQPRFAATAKPSARRSRVALLRGCVGNVYERDTLRAARHLLEALGHEVVETTSGDCCGALPRHAGDVAGAARAAARTRDTLQSLRAEVVLTCSSGCRGDLRDQVRPDGAHVADATAFIVGDDHWPSLRFRTLEQRAALHLPCTQVNVVGGIEPIRAGLARIPGLSVVDLPAQPRCCGAAGNYFLENPEIADRLRDEKLAQTAASAPDLLLTTNVGCRIHLGNGLREAASPLEILHPLALLARQLDNAAP